MIDEIPNSEILDATQDAVLNAASSVANVLENTAQELGYGHEAFYLEAEFWVGAAFVLVVSGLFRPVGKALRGLLKKRSDTIAERIKEAVTLKEEAQKLLAGYERKFKGAEKEAAEILMRSEREIEAVKKESLARLEAEMAIKEHEAKARLKTIENNAMQEITDKTADLTMATVKKILEERLDDEAKSRLIDLSIERLEDAS